jgi:hypothetical protein
MEKKDYKKEFASFYQVKKGTPVMVDVPDFNFIQLEGEGNPNTNPLFAKTIEALFSVAYTAKFMIKKTKEIDFGVMPLEALWWTDDMNEFSPDNKDIWKWTCMIMQPPEVNAEIISEAKKQAKEKKNNELIEKIRYDKFHEGRAAQILHIGPYSEEAPTIATLHEFVKNNGYKLSGKHREIYLNDKRRCASSKLKTIIRQPVASL